MRTGLSSLADVYCADIYVDAIYLAVSDYVAINITLSRHQSADILIFKSVRIYLSGQILYGGHFPQPNIQKITILCLRILLLFDKYFV